jgi:uncharacterized protein YggT (Ycf19 family)
MLNALERLFLRPFQKRISTYGNVDLSPLFVLVMCQLLLMTVAWFEGVVVRAIV